MFFDISLGQNAHSMQTFRNFWDFVLSLYELEWNFFGYTVTLKECILGTACIILISYCLHTFLTMIGLTPDFESFSFSGDPDL